MKKNKVMTMLAILGTSLLLGSCSFVNNPNTNGDANLPNDITEKSNKKEVSYQLITSASLIPDTNPVMDMKLMKALGSETQTQTTNTQVTDLLKQIDVFTSTTEDKISIVSQTSDRSEYTNLDVVTYTDISNTQKTMSLYLKHDDDDDDLFDTEVEVKTRLEGLMVTENSENAFIAMKEDETDVDEQESEISTKIFTSDDKTSYILASRSYETETELGKTETEISYEYAVFNNGMKQESFSYEYEVENNKEEVELKYGTSNFFIKMESENGRTIFKVVDKSTNTTTRYLKTVLDDGLVTYVEIK